MEIQFFIHHITLDLGSVITLITGIIIPAIKYYRKKYKQKQVAVTKPKKYTIRNDEN